MQNDHLNPFAALPAVGVTRPLEVFRMLGISRATGYAWIKSGRLPRPMSLGPNVMAIPNSALRAWGEDRAAEAGAALEAA